MGEIINRSKARVYRPKEKIYNILWTFHQNDVDDRPSVPHGHSQDNKYRLSIWDGKVYRKQSGKLILEGRAKKSDINKLYNDPKFNDFVLKSREWYKEKHKYCPELKSLITKSSIKYDSDVFRVTIPVHFIKTGGEINGRIKFKTNYRQTKCRVCFGNKKTNILV